jgi:hypothetical protein
VPKDGTCVPKDAGLVCTRKGRAVVKDEHLNTRTETIEIHAPRWWSGNQFRFLMFHFAFCIYLLHSRACFFLYHLTSVKSPPLPLFFIASHRGKLKCHIAATGNLVFPAVAISTFTYCSINLQRLIP